VLLIPSILSHAQNYLDAREIKYATMAESLEALRYIRNQTSEHDLLVISIEDMALRRNLEPLIAKRMLRVLQDGRLDGIVFLGHRNISANHIVDTIKLPPSSTDFLMRVEVDIGKMRIYRMNVNVTPLFPLEPDMSFSQQWGKFRNPKLSETENPTHSFLGQKSLQINKNVKEDVLVYSPSTNNISSEGRSFVFYGYAKKYQQKSKAGLLVRESPPPVLLNGLFGIFREKKNDLIWEWIHPHFFIISDRLKDKEPFKWEIMLTLLPLNSGLNEIKKSLFLKDQISYFDGFQGYLLTPKEKK